MGVRGEMKQRMSTQRGCCTQLIMLRYNEVDVVDVVAALIRATGSGGFLWAITPPTSASAAQLPLPLEALLGLP